MLRDMNQQGHEDYGAGLCVMRVHFGADRQRTVHSVKVGRGKAQKGSDTLPH